MLYNEVKKVIRLDEEREITISTGKYAKQADGSVIVQQGDTMLLATVVAAKDAKDDCDFMPLSVEYREKYAAAGRYPGGFLKREARPSDSEILVSRLIDRALRRLKKKLDKEGTLKELRNRRHYEKPSEIKHREDKMRHR